MSDSSSDSRSSGSGRQRRSGGPRRRSGGNRNNRNRNNRNNRDGGGGDGGGGGGRGRGQGRRSGGGRQSGPRRPAKPAPLTFWQKILKAIGLYDPDKPTKRTSPSRVPKPAEKKIKTKGRSKPGPRAEQAKQVPVDTNRLYVGNLSYDATELDLEDLFKGIGAVKSVEIVYNSNTHRSKGFGFVTMTTVEEAQRAVDTLHDQSFMDRQMIVSGSKSTGPAKPTTAPKEETFDLGAGNDDASPEPTSEESATEETAVESDEATAPEAPEDVDKL